MNMFKDIKGYENYSINPEGKVYSKKYDRFLKPSKNNNGYIFVNLIDSHKIAKTHSVHKMVMEYFGAQKPGDNYVIDHIDGDKTNPIISNLQWVSIKDNTIKYYDNHEKKKEIISLVNDGYKVKDIVEKVGLSEHTVRQTIKKFRAGIL